MNIFKRIRTRYILHRHAIGHDLWSATAEKLAFLQGMTAVEKAHLRELSTLFLYEKKFFGAQEWKRALKFFQFFNKKASKLSRI